MHYVSIWARWLRTSAGAASDGDAIHIGWARDAYLRLSKYRAGRYANTVMYDFPNDTQLSYEPTAWERLQSVKQTYDPRGLFRSLDYYRPIDGISLPNST